MPVRAAATHPRPSRPGPRRPGATRATAPGTVVGPPAAGPSAPGPSVPGVSVPGVPARLRPAEALLESARQGLAEAAAASLPADRYAAAHLAALRLAAAVLAERARPAPGRGRGRRVRPTSAWVLLARVAPELAEWAAFFATGARTRAAAEAGDPRAATVREADDLLRDAERFLAVVERSLGRVHQPVLPSRGSTPGRPSREGG